MDALVEPELVRKRGVDRLRPGHGIDIGTYIVESVVVLLEGITEF